MAEVPTVASSIGRFRPTWILIVIQTWQTLRSWQVRGLIAPIYWILGVRLTMV
jgi:hypothetical protein